MSKTASPPVAGVELLPCPFCGGTNIDPEGWMAQDTYGQTSQGPTCDDCDAAAASVTAWNTRALSSPVGGDGSSSPKSEDTYRAGEGAVLATDLRLVNDLIYTHGGDAALAGWVRIVSVLPRVAPPSAASGSPGMETLQASECTKHGEGEQ